MKKKGINKDKYFNYYKMRYFRRNSITPNIQPLKKKDNKVIC